MRCLIALLVVLALAPGSAWAAVRMSFYSHDFGEYYPHGFVVLRGPVESAAGYVDDNFGWTSTAANIVLTLAGPVNGVVSRSADDYVRKSTEEFSLVLTDAQFAAVMARVEAWRDLPQPSYSLARANCVYFVADMARAAGLKADPPGGLMLKPKAYLRAVRAANAAQIAARAGPPAGGGEVLAAPRPLSPPPAMFEALGDLY